MIATIRNPHPTLATNSPNALLFRQLIGLYILPVRQSTDKPC